MSGANVVIRLADQAGERVFGSYVIKSRRRCAGQLCPHRHRARASDKLLVTNWLEEVMPWMVLRWPPPSART